MLSSKNRYLQKQHQCSHEYAIWKHINLSCLALKVKQYKMFSKHDNKNLYNNNILCMCIANIEKREKIII